MKPAPFSYHAPESLGEAVAILHEHGDGAKVLAGGQSLIPIMNMRLARPAVLVDVCRVAALAGVEADGALTIGATTRQAAALRDPLVARHAPLIGAALGHVGHAANRTRGTVGGSIAHGDPASEMPAVLLALDGEVVVRGAGGERTIAGGDLYITYLSTDLAVDEVLTAVRIPAVAAGLRRTWGFSEVARRHGDYALAGLAMTADVAAGGDVSQARIALFGVSDVPVRATGAEAVLAGARLDDPDVLDAAVAAVATDLDPPDDVHASGRYRKRAVAALLRRAVGQATEQLKDAA